MTYKTPSNLKVLSCQSNQPLAASVANLLGINLTKTNFRRFSDGEMFVEIEENVRGDDVYVIQSTSSPANDNLMELLITLDALHRSSTRRITAVIPYYGYARQDRKSSPRSPITAKLVANLITAAGATRVLTLDLHAGQIQGFFDIPVDNLYAEPLFARHVKNNNNQELESTVIVSPDVGGVVRARALAKRLNCELAIIDKRRPEAGKSEVMNIVGDVSDRHCIIVDDMVDSGGTHCNAAQALIEKGGAKTVDAYITHGVLSGRAVELIDTSYIRKMVLTDSILNHSSPVRSSQKIERITIANLMSDAIIRIANNESVSSLFL